MVVDEELKMMGQVCHRGGRLVGPRLREMARLAHTEYLISGETDLDVREILRATMFAPTVTGSPLQSACQVIARHEGRGRGYYGGVLALIGRRHGARTLDSAILIRTADLTDGGRLEIGVGSTLVRHCIPAEEVAETRAKVAGLLAATAGAATAGAAGTAELGTAELGAAGTRRRPRLAADPRVRRALAARNDGLARFWLAPGVRHRAATGTLPEARPAGLAGRRILVVDAEDAFTAMLAHQVRALGPDVTIRHYGDVLGSEFLGSDAFDAVIVGPGPGDPRDVAHPTIAALRRLTRALIVTRRPFLSVCLGHQVLAGLLGLALRRKEPPAQGVAREIDFFGQRRRVGFYNTFAAHSQTDAVACGLTGESVEVSREASTGEVHGLRKPGLRSVQFHLESVLTERGLTILRDLLTPLLPAQPLPAQPSAGGRTRRV
jgi:phenazine biosynthesis protein phzE